MSLPYFEGDAPQEFVRYWYDNLGRVQEESWGNSSPIRQYEYGVVPALNPWNQSYGGYDTGSSVTIARPGLADERVVYDGLGRVEELVSGLGQISHVRYGVNHMVATDAVGNKRLAFEDLRRGESLFVDPSSGQRLMRRNAFGDVVLLATNSGAEVYFEYDDVGRTTRRVDPEGATSFTYDSFCGQVEPGSLMRVERSDSSGRLVHDVRYGYDQFGREKVIVQSIGDRDYRTSVAYSLDGLVARTVQDSLDDHESLVLEYDYGLGGVLIAVREAGEDVLWSLEDVDAALRPTRESFGGVVERRTSYHLRTGRPASSQLSMGALGVFEEDSYTYDEDVALLLKTREFLRFQEGVTVGFREEFTYDSLGRVVASEREGVGGVCDEPGGECQARREFVYDSVGNVESKDGLEYLYDGAYQVTSTSDGRSFQYDADGNQEWRAGDSLTFSWFGLPTEIVTASDETIEVTYGIDDRRVRKAVSSGKVVDYAGPGYQRVAEGGVVWHLYRVAPNIEIVRSGPRERVRWEQVDNLGSVYMMISSVDGLAEPTVADVVGGKVSYDAFGKCVSADWRGTAEDGCISLGTPFGYGGHEHECDLSVDLINMGGRIYDPFLGRMLSPDPVLFLGEGLNSYSFAFNSPLNYTDPSGFCGKGEKNGLGGNDYGCDGGDGDSEESLSGDAGGGQGIVRGNVGYRMSGTPGYVWKWLSNHSSGGSGIGAGGDRLPETGVLCTGAEGSDRRWDPRWELKPLGHTSFEGDLVPDSLDPRHQYDVRIFPSGRARRVPATSRGDHTDAGLRESIYRELDGGWERLDFQMGSVKELIEQGKEGYKYELVLGGFIGALSGFGRLSVAGRYGVKPYSEMSRDLKGTGLRAHHLIEKRFTDLFGGKAREGLSIAVTPAEHQMFTNAWRSEIGYGAGTRAATARQVMDAARRIYSSHPAILRALGL